MYVYDGMLWLSDIQSMNNKVARWRELTATTVCVHLPTTSSPMYHHHTYLHTYLHTLVASCLRGALPPVDLRAVCLVRAMMTAAAVLLCVCM